MKHENCESKVANLLASLDNLPLNDVLGRVRVMKEIVEAYTEKMAVQDKKIEALNRQINEGKEESACFLPMLPRKGEV